MPAACDVLVAGGERSHLVYEASGMTYSGGSVCTDGATGVIFFCTMFFFVVPNSVFVRGCVSNMWNF